MNQILTLLALWFSQVRNLRRTIDRDDVIKFVLFTALGLLFIGFEFGLVRLLLARIAQHPTLGELRVVLMDEEGIAPTARIPFGEPIQQPRLDDSRQSDDSPMPHLKGPAGLAHVMQQGGHQQVRIVVSPRPQGTKDVQAVALVVIRHPAKELHLGRSEVFAQGLKLLLPHPRHQRAKELDCPTHLEPHQQVMKQAIRRSEDGPQDTEGQYLVNQDEQYEDEGPLRLHPVQDIGPLVSPGRPDGAEDAPQHAVAVQGEDGYQVEDSQADVDAYHGEKQNPEQAGQREAQPDGDGGHGGQEQVGQGPGRSHQAHAHPRPLAQIQRVDRHGLPPADAEAIENAHEQHDSADGVQVDQRVEG